MTLRAERAAWLTAPILIAGLVHVAVITLDLVPRLAKPIDADRRWRGLPLLGWNKTWRGFVVMPAATAMTIAAQQALGARSPRLGGLAPLRRGAPPPWVVGAICGAAYVLAELPNSFVKRRLGIAPGASAPRARAVQYIVDQLDSVIGCAVAIRILYRISIADAAGSALLGAGCHVAVERLMRALPRRKPCTSLSSPPSSSRSPRSSSRPSCCAGVEYVLMRRAATRTRRARRSRLCSLPS